MSQDAKAFIDTTSFLLQHIMKPLQAFPVSAFSLSYSYYFVILNSSYVQKDPSIYSILKCE